MPRESRYVIALTAGERKRVAAIAPKYTSSYRDVMRATITLYAATGLGNEEIAARLDMPHCQQVA